MSQPQQCLSRIHSKYSEFSQKEKRVADYILNSPENFIHKTIDQVAEDLDVAISTVFRFTKTLGFKGFQSMKITLASEITEPIREMVEEKILENDNEQAITEKIFNNNIRMFKETIQVMDFSSIKKAVNMMIQANRVEFYGSENSGIVALDAHHKFIGTGISTAAYNEYHLQVKAASQLTENDVAIFISHSGSDEEMVRVLQIAKDNGAKIIAITNNTTAKLSHLSDIVLKTVSINSGITETDDFSRIIQLSLIDSIYVNVLSAKKSMNIKGPLEKLKNYLGK